MGDKKVWFVTGAGRGMGVDIAKAALAAGHAVVATARNTGTVTAALGQDDDLLAVKLDVTDPADAQAAVHAAVDRFGRIDVLVNNAGYGLLGAVEETSARELEQLYATNVFGLVAVTRAVLPAMRRQRSGHVINMSSVGGYQSGAGFGVYCSTKFAVEGLSEALAAELKPLGIYVSVVEPGYFRTDFLDQSSLVRTERTIDDYAETVGALRGRVGSMNHAQPGDPSKLAKAMISLADTKQPPLRLALGSDTVAAIEAKNAHVAEELAAFRALSLSTDFGAEKA
jgi:NAD(P)-dependent dehydrogenase (short-subunit alcohol dehydrogenase family)